MRPLYPRIVTSKRLQAGIEHVPVQYKPMQQCRYPIDNNITFERWYMETYLSSDARDRVYLPVQWTALYCNGNFGEDKTVIRQLQQFLDKLDTTKKYYTIVQFDDGILNNIDHLDIKVFAMSGPRIDYPLPLLCTPHKFRFDEKRDIFASFVGRETHPIRTEMIKQLEGKEGYYISTKEHGMKEYCRILARSKYALCPRGYGQSSFRIQEAIEFGAVPVYISDEHILPYRQFLFGYAIEPQTNYDHYLKVTLNTWCSRLPADKHLFTYPGCKQMILHELTQNESN